MQKLMESGAIGTLTDEHGYELVDRQIQLEMEMVGLGKDRYWRRVEKNQEKGRESQSVPQRRLVAESIEPMAAKIREYIDGAKTGRAMNNAKAYKELKDCEPEVVAYIATRTIFDTLGRYAPLLQVARRIGTGIETELRLQEFEATNKGLFKAISEDLKKQGSTAAHKRRVLVYAMNKAEIHWDQWADRDKKHVGLKCIDLFLQSTGLVEIKTQGTGKRKSKVLSPTEETSRWLSESHHRCEELAPCYMPMLVPPLDWGKDIRGGYLTKLPGRFGLVKNASAEHMEAVRNADLSVVHAAVNAMQRTAFKVNQPVYEVLYEVWDRGLPLGKLPSRFAVEVPTRPIDIETNKEARKAWAKKAAPIIKKNITEASSREAVSETLSAAKKFHRETAIYFPYQLDFRSRVYAVPGYLNPQGPDYAKGILTFAEGLPIRDQTAADWLAIHGANTAGEDKISFKDRLQWVDDNELAILAVAANPLDYTWWSTLDKPWQFLAWCFEWAGYLTEGFGFVSHLPIALDGSCNGIQHFAAMLRSEKDGAAVNLVPAELPQDIYGNVAKRAVEHLPSLREQRSESADSLSKENATLAATEGDTPGEEKKRKKKLAENRKKSESFRLQADAVYKWLEYGVTRKTAKQPVMTMPYGSTLRGCEGMVEAHLAERAKDGDPHPFTDKDELEQAIRVVCLAIWESIGEEAEGSRAVMGWLKECALEASAQGEPLRWVTPAGFPVVQKYVETKRKLVKTMMWDSVEKRSLRLDATHHEDTDAINGYRQASGIAPNFVHSMDAAAMYLTINSAAQQGVHNFAMVHDSYGTHAANTSALAATLRQAFVDMYEEHDVLQQFRDRLASYLPQPEELPEPPSRGKLDLQGVLDSSFFFA